MNPSLYQRHNFYNTLSFGAFMFGALFSVSQVNTQRICSVATLRDANIVLSINMIGMALIQIIIFFGGLITYAFYAGCDPLLTGKIQRKDEILSFMIYVLICVKCTSCNNLERLFMQT
ncbi:Sodium-coupled monocarboxylate transporter 1 [Armadillidium vulgare]|nr:Sodium-coupled monocarboxylate transporter 1 [Armadillidium vulgare]